MGTLTRWGVLLVVGACTISRMSPPPVTSASAPAEKFSAERARIHLDAFSQAPRPIGGAAARVAEAYIVRYLESLRLRVETQETPACTTAAGMLRCAHVRNVIGTLPGRDSTSAVMLSAHYDTVPNAPGAADDGAGIAALLETARALSGGTTREHDIVFAFVDGEEDLLIGSAALGQSWPGFANVRLAVNFEARGSRGASALFAGSSNVGAIIDEFARIASRPIANSFFWALGSVLPNTTDAEMYDKFGVKTLSFAFAEGFQNYHQGTDLPAALDLRSLEHHGRYALEIAQHFADVDLRALAARQGDDVFFDVFGVFVIRYSIFAARMWGAGMALLVALLCSAIVRRGGASWRGIFSGAAVFLGFLVAVALFGTLVEKLVTWGWSPWSSYVHAGALTGSIAVLVLSAFVRVQGAQQRRWGDDAPLLGPIVLSALLGLITLVWAPGASLVFVWPAAFATLAWIASRTRGLSAVAWLLLVPVVIIECQVVYTGIAVVGGDGIALPLVWMGLLFGLIGPALLPKSYRTPPFVRGLAAAAVVLALIVSVVGRLGAAPPVGNAVTYAVDAQKLCAFWLSSDAANDEWKRQFLGASPARARLPAFISEMSTLFNTAPWSEIAAPTLDLVSDVENGGMRELTLRVRSPRQARAIAIWESTGARFSSFSFDGSKTVRMVRFSPEADEKLFRMVAGIGYEGKWAATLFAVPDEGSLVRLVTESRGALEFRAVDRSSGLAVIPPNLRPRGPTWTPGYPGDETWVSGLPRVVAARAPR